MTRADVVRFACWLFGHRIEVPMVDRDARSCECKQRSWTNTLLTVAQPELKKRRWRL